MDNNNYNNYNNGDYSAPQQDNPNNQYNTNGQYDANNQYQYNTNGQYDANNQYQYNTNGQYDANGQYQYNINGQYYGNGQYNGYNNGQGPVDANGKPIPNNFGMKLTFSILVTIFLSRIFGILSIVFTCQQNSAYKEGRWDDFKNKKKLSNVFLWIGLVVGVLLFILSIALFGVAVKETFDMVDYYEYSYSYDDDEDEDEDDRHSSDRHNDDEEDDMATSDVEEEDTLDSSDGFTYGESTFDFEQVEYITINGSEVGVPMSVQEFIDITGYRDYDVDVETLDLDAHNGGELVYIDDENGYSLIDIYNGTDDTIKAIDGVIGGIKLDFEYTTSPIQFNYRGITNDSTIDDVLAVFGEAGTRYDSEYGVELSYYTTNGWVEFDWDEYGDMTSIWIENNGEID